MKPHEILQKIIDEKGSCDWANTQGLTVCNVCPMSRKKTCLSFVHDKRKATTNDDYMDVAKKLLADLEASRIILGEDIEE
jgi:hypothetical protein